ncbi:MAG: Molybdate/tungstate import ATP-binding protein WtpC [Methanosaeta sp. PtaB.Bin039]|nr:MAG: Molybdate/tungstate import ATP-binding protein WtpC [Methanosaeta sp. PtaB.Bin039]
MGKIKEYGEFFSRYAYHYKFHLAILMFLSALSLLFVLITPLILKSLIDNVFLIVGKTEASTLVGDLLYWSLIILVVFIISSISIYYNQYVSGRLRAEISNDLREQIFCDLNQKSLQSIWVFKRGDLINRIMDDVDRAEQIVTTYFVRLLTIILGMLFPMIIMLLMKYDLAIICTVPMLLYAMISWKFGKIMSEQQRMFLNQRASVTSFINEGISSFPLIKVFELENYQKERFNIFTQNYKNITIKLSKTVALYASLTGFNVLLPLILLFWIGGHMIIVGEITIGTFIAFSSYVTQFFGPVKELSNLWPEIKMSDAAFDRIMEIISMDNENPENHKDELRPTTGRIEIKNLTYSHGGKIIFSNLNASFENGLNYLLGKNGTGKSTLFYLIVKLYQPDSGTIEIDGKNINYVDARSIRRNISFLQQDSKLLDTTIYENILLGDIKSSEEDIFEAAKLANVHDFITRLPEGYQTLVGENGMVLSGGERQKIALARAILKDSKIMILDEMEKSIDESSKNSIIQTLSKLSNHKTIILATHENPSRNANVVDLNKARHSEI